jgi:long-chain fatty acid transport protein
MLQPLSWLRIGPTHQSPVDFKFGFHPFITGLSPGLSAALKKSGLLGAKVNLGQTEPQQFMASGLYQLTSAFALMGNIGWQDLSQYGQTTLGISAEKQKRLAVNLIYSNTIQIAFGGQYRLGERWPCWSGFAHDSSPVSEANRTPSLPLDHQLRFGAGLQYAINNAMTAGIANEVLDGSGAPYDAQRGRSLVASRATSRATSSIFWP